MLILFIVIMLAGLGAFAYVFMQASKTAADEPKVSLRDIQQAAEVVSVKLPQPDISTAELATLKIKNEEAELRIAKLEEMLAEKNRTIAALEQGVSSKEDQQGQMDNLKNIFQSQIEELKGQNKQLKDEMSRVLEENLDLQTRVYAARASAPSAAEVVEVRPMAEAEPSVQATHEVPQKSVSQGGLSLHDVFGGEEQGNDNSRSKEQP